MQEVQHKRYEEIRKRIESANISLEKMLRHQVPISIHYKKTCVELIAILRLMRFEFMSLTGLDPLLEQCIKNIKIIVQSLETERYGHRFPYFSLVVARYEGAFLKKTDTNKKSIQTLKTKLNEKFQEENECNSLLSISPRQIRFLTTQNVQSFFVDLQNNEHILQNPKCLGCSQALIKNQPILNQNSSFASVLHLSNQNCIENITLERYINSLCNQGGGIILIGAENKSGGLGEVSGIKYRSYDQIIQRQKQLIKTFRNVRPPCRYSVQTLFVHTNYCENTQVADEYLRVCFRLKVFPQRADKASYLQFSAKGYQNVYEIYDLDNLSQPEKVQKGQNMYKKLYQLYYKKQKSVNEHQNICCSRALPNYSKIFNSQILSGEITQEDLLNSISWQQSEENQSTYKLKDQPEFVYANTSLLAVGTQKDDRYIKQFAKFLTKNKQQVVLSKPFSKSFKNCSRSIWMLSHKKTTGQINEQLTNFSALKFVPVGTIYLIPVKKMLQIQCSKFSLFQQKSIQKRLKQRYNELYKTETAVVVQKNKEKEIFFMIFNDFTQAIYAYLSFEQLNLRPYFVSEYSLNKTKGKKVPYHKND